MDLRIHGIYMMLVCGACVRNIQCDAVQVWWSKIVTVGVHFMLGAFLLRHAQQVDLHNPNSITAAYMLIWKLFYSEYLLIPFFR